MQPGSFIIVLVYVLVLVLVLVYVLVNVFVLVLVLDFPLPQVHRAAGGAGGAAANPRPRPAPPSRCTRCQGRPTSYALPAQVQLEPLSCLLAAPRFELAVKGVTQALARLLAARDLQALLLVQGGVGCGALGRCAGAD